MADATSALACVLVEILAGCPDPAQDFHAGRPRLEADIHRLNADFTIGAKVCELPHGILPRTGEALDIAYPDREMDSTSVFLKVVGRLWEIGLDGDIRISILTVDSADPAPPKTWPGEHHLPSFLDAAFIHPPSPSWLRRTGGDLDLDLG